MGTQHDNPLTGAPPEEVPLSNSPLIRVIAQVQFPLILSIERPAFIASFQEAIRERYPILREEHSKSVVLGLSNGEAQPPIDKKTWRFHDLEGSWRVTLETKFLALETMNYGSRDEFLERFEHVLSALSQHIKIPIIDRLGIRYIDRITGDELESISRFVRLEVAGVIANPALAGHTKQAVTANLFELSEESGQLVARWGLIPAFSTADPSTMPPLHEASWILDLDASCSESRPFDVTETTSRTRAFSERIYSFFRWVVTEDFLNHYGGKL